VTLRPLQIVPASVRDLVAITALLDDLALPTAGLGDQFPRAYVTALRAGAMVGCAGLETYQRSGLLRSVAVSLEARRDGLGRALVADRIAAAKAMKLDAVYLLTTTASDYFPRLGFLPIERSAVGGPVASSPEFASVCPASARCFVLHL
jgi:amino-acid N-acetyltransferase